MIKGIGGVYLRKNFRGVKLKKYNTFEMFKFKKIKIIMYIDETQLNI